MSVRYLSHGIGIRRSPKTAVIQPWFRRGTFVQVGTDIAYGKATFGASAHTKGAWGQAVASTASDVSLVALTITSNAVSATDTSALLDIGVGAAGSETVIVPDIASGALAGPLPFMLPVAIPSGSRIAIRAQSIRTSPSFLEAGVTLFGTSDYKLTPSSLDIIGIDTTTSTGTAMSGASGTWVQITASTAKDYQNLVLVHSSSSSDIASINVLYTVGVGAAGSERAIGNSLVRYNSTESVNWNNGMAIAPLSGEPIPAGSRIAVRHNIAANPGRYNVCLLGVPYV